MTDFTTDQISCDTEQTEERKFSDLETEVEHPDISASVISDVLPESVLNVEPEPLTSEILSEGCGHVKARLVITDRMVWIANGFCPKCGEKL